jgi:2-C-methyl-D-erythritol 4-phosphate cytidylyltransferase
VGLILVAAGSGTRLGADVPKAFVPLAGVPILGHALRGARSCPDVAEVVVVAPPAWLAQAEEVCRWAGSRAHARFGAYQVAPSGEREVPPRAVPDPSSEREVPVMVVAGGSERGDSVAAGLAALSAGVEVVLVHDAARCLTPVGVFDRVIEAVRSGAPAVVPGLAVVDTVKEVDESGAVVRTPDRSRLRAVQTPQGFRRDVLLRAHALPDSATDDAALVERLGEVVLVVDGDPQALKVTTADDLDAAARILAG